jgi:hypothetical protein
LKPAAKSWGLENGTFFPKFDFQSDLKSPLMKLGSEIVIVPGIASNIWVKRVDPHLPMFDKRTIFGPTGLAESASRTK